MKKALLIVALVCLLLTAAHAQTNPPAGSNLGTTKRPVEMSERDEKFRELIQLISQLRVAAAESDRLANREEYELAAQQHELIADLLRRIGIIKIWLETCTAPGCGRAAKNPSLPESAER